MNPHDDFSLPGTDKWTLVESDENQCPSYWRYNRGLLKDPDDPTEYQLVKLLNGMMILLGSNQSTPIACATVAFPAGLLDQPVRTIGMN